MVQSDSIKKIVDFNVDINPSLRRLCDPLFQCLGFNAFGYTRFTQGQRLILETHEPWLRKYSEIQFREHLDSDRSLLANVKIATERNNHSLILTGEPKTEVHSILFSMDLWNSISLYIKNKESVEVFHFSTHRANTEMVNLYVNSADLLKRFVLYFKEQLPLLLGDNPPVLDSLSMAEVEKLFPSKDRIPRKVKDFLRRTEMRKVYVSSHDLFIGRREAQCLAELSKGKTQKQMAHAMKISHRTVEQYLASLKDKIQIPYRSELIRIGKMNAFDDIIID